MVLFSVKPEDDVSFVWVQTVLAVDLLNECVVVGYFED